MTKFATIALAALMIGTPLASAAAFDKIALPPPPPPPPGASVQHISAEPEACFYTAVDLKQSYFCVRGKHVQLPVEKIWRGRIQSVEIHSARVKMCDEPMLHGNCFQTDLTQKELPASMFNKVRSISIR